MDSETTQLGMGGMLARIDVLVKRFEEAWRGPVPPSLDDFLQGEGEARFALLVELVHADLEFRFRQGEVVRTESYCERYPELTCSTQTIVELVWAEYQLHRARTPGLLIDEMLRDRPELQAAIGHSMDRDSPVAVPEIPGYKLCELLGRGGMGIVYRAKDVRLNRDVAIKFDLSGELASPLEQARFLREAKSAAALHHPQVLQIYDFGCYERHWYLILEFAPGGSLAKKLSGRPLVPLEAAKLLVGLAEAIEFAHQKQIIHRDLKPANILIGEGGCAKIADFGLAKQLSQDSSWTQDDILLATPSYSAPELVFGQKNIDPRSADPRSADIYSLGAVLYETLTGRPPYIGSSALDIVEQLRTSDVIHPRRLNPAIPQDLENVCLKCLEHDPKRRYATAQEMAKDLVRFIYDQPVLARPIPMVAILWRWVRRNQGLAAAIAASVILLISTSVIATYSAMKMAELSSRERVAYESQRTAWAKTEEAQEANTDWQQAAGSVLESLKQSIPGSSSGSFVEPVSLNLDARRNILRSQFELVKRRKDIDFSKRVSELAELSETLLTLGAYPDAHTIGQEAVHLFTAEKETAARYPVMFAIALHALGRAETEVRMLESAESRFNLAHDLLLKANVDQTDASYAELTLSRARLWMLAGEKSNLIEQCQLIQDAAETISRTRGPDTLKAIFARTIAINTVWAAGKAGYECVKDLEILYRQIEGKRDLGFIQLIVADNIAVLHQRLNQFEQAERWIDEALKLVAPVFGSEQHPVRSDLYSDAAWIKHSRGKQAKSLELYRDAYRIRENTIGKDFETRERRGEYFVRLLRQGEQLELTAERIKIEPEIAGFDWRDAFVLKSAFSNALLHGEIEAARRVATKFGELADASSSPHAQEQFDIMQAEIACILGDFSGAALLADHWLEDVFVEPEATIRRGRFKAWQFVGEQLGWLGRPHVFEQAVTRWRESLPDQFLDFHVDELYECCDTIDQLGRDTKLLPKLDAWQRSKPAQVHNRHPCEGMLRCATARQLQAIGKPKEARTAAEQGLQILEESLGPHHHWTLDAMQLLAELHGELQDKKRAGGLAREILARAERACGTDCPVVAHWKATVAVRCFANASPAHVYDDVCQESLELIRRKLGPYHPMTLECVGSSAWVLTASGTPEQADKLLDEALATLQARAQPHSPWIFWLSGVQRKIVASRISPQDLEKQVIETQVINECADYIQQFWGASDWRVRMLRN